MPPADRPTTGALERRDSTAGIVQRRDVVLLWGIAVLCFGVGDVVTTSIGLRLTGVFEAHPIALQFFQYSPLGAMVALKAFIFGGSYALWRWTPEPYRVGVPVGLATLGVAVVAWNLKVLFLAVTV